MSYAETFVLSYEVKVMYCLVQRVLCAVLRGQVKALFLAVKIMSACIEYMANIVLMKPFEPTNTKAKILRVLSSLMSCFFACLSAEDE